MAGLFPSHVYAWLDVSQHIHRPLMAGPKHCILLLYIDFVEKWMKVFRFKMFLNSDIKFSKLETGVLMSKPRKTQGGPINIFLKNNRKEVALSNQ
jgi:hypothetical protein